MKQIKNTTKRFTKSLYSKRLALQQVHFFLSQGAEESYLTVMPAKFISQIDLVLNVTEQNIMLSSYASGEILSATCGEEKTTREETKTT